MVCIIHECHCDHCPGSTRAKPNKHSKPGEMVFGGTLCHCECHKYSGKKRKIFLDIKYNRIPNERGLREKFNSDLSKLQKECKHELVSEWLNSMWAPGHFGLPVKVCLVCNKTMEIKEFDPEYDSF